MSWIRRNALLIVIIVALAAGLVFSVSGRGQTQKIEVQGVERTNKALQSANMALVELRGQIIKGCERTNDRVKENNRRAGLHNKQNTAIRLVGANARDARLSDFRATGDVKDRVLADNYQNALNYLDNIRFEKFKKINCEREYPPIPALPPVE